MFVTQFLDVLIGLAFVYLLLSLVASSVLEAVAGLTARRARGLKQAIEGLLSGGSETIEPAIKCVTEEVLDHALIRSLRNRPNLLQRKTRLFAAGPSYIPARTFATALVDVLRQSPLPREPSMVSTLSTEQLDDGHLKQTLRTLNKNAGGDPEKVRLSIERWYEDAMDRFSGQFKRYSQLWLFMIGVVIAASLNVDSVWLAQRLWQDPTLRESVVTQARAYAEQHPQPPASLKLDEMQKTLKNELPMPIGWPSEKGQNSFLIVVGWFITGVAVSFGAPIWFDGLGLLLSVRASGPKPTAATSTNGLPVTDDGTTTDFERSLGKVDIMDLQTVLGLRGKRVTGQIDGPTRDAIMDYQDKHGLPQTGKLTQELLLAIMDV